MSVLIIAGVSNMAGVSKASGNQYSMNRVIALIPSENRDTANYSLKSLGLRTVELEVGSNCYQALHDRFQQNFKGLPVPIDVETSMNGEGKTVITGVK